MIEYNYTAKNKAGEILKGVVEADSNSSAAKVLSSRDLFAINISPKQTKNLNPFSRITAKDKVFLMRQLATTISAGLPIAQALETLETQTSNKKLKSLISSVSRDVEGGSSLSSSFQQFPKVFGQIDITMIQTGETTGTLDKTLERLASTIENDFRIIRKIRGALIYPGFILVVVVGVVAMMTIYVLPQMEGLYASFGNAKLPFLTRMVLVFSHGMTRYSPVIAIVLTALCFAVRAFKRTPRGRYFFDSLKLNIPLYKIFMRNIYISRFTRTLASLVGSGVSLIDSLNIVSRAVGNKYYEDVLKEAASQVKGGKPLSEPLKESDLFPPIVPQMVNVGEKTGEMDGMLTNLANYYEEEVDNFTKSITSLMEPVMIVVMAAVVGVLLIAIMLPIYSIGKITG